MYASCVKNIFLRISSSGRIIALQPTSIEFLKIDTALQDVPFTFYVEIVSIVLDRPWRNPFGRETTDEKRKNVICIILDRGAEAVEAQYISLFYYVSVEKHLKPSFSRISKH